MERPGYWDWSRVSRGRVGDEVKDIRGGQVVWGPVGHCNDFGFYLE